MSLKITYIKHSGFLVETDHSNMLFDYCGGELPSTVEGQKLLFIFVSHAHGDHYSKEIFGLKPHGEVHYILSDDIDPGTVPAACKDRVLWAAPHKTYDLHICNTALKITTLQSNDLGVAFLVEEDGLRLYHAGDLNNWWWDGDADDKALEEQYHAELERIRGMHFDAAFIPLDPRLKGWWKGVTDFMSYADAVRIIPMHDFGDHSMPAKLRKLPDVSAYVDRIEDNM